MSIHPLRSTLSYDRRKLSSSYGSAFFIVLVCILSTRLLWAVEPSVKYIFPAGGQRGTTVEFRVGGHYFHGAASFAMAGDGITSCDRVEETKTVWFEGPMIFKPFSQRAEDYPKDHLGAVKIKDAAELGLRHWQVWTSQGVTPGRPFVVGDLPEIVEDEIDGAPIAEKITLPVTINGRIFPREDVDIWRFEAKTGDQICCEVVASRIQSPLDSRIEIRTPDGKRAAENIDFYGTDSFLKYQATQTGTHEIRIHDIRFAGLQDYVYRLTMTKEDDYTSPFPNANTTQEIAKNDPPDPSFQLGLPSDALNVVRGQSAKLKITAKRMGGFADDIELAAIGLPDGIQIKNNVIPKNQTEIELEFSAIDSAIIAASKIQIKGTATIAGQQIEKMAVLNRDFGTTTTNLRLAVCMPTPFKLDGLSFNTNFASRGTIHRRHYVIDRGGFNGPLKLRLADKQIRHQQGVTGQEIEIPPGETEVDYPIRLPTWLEMDRTGRTVLMLVGTIKDKDGSEHICSYTSSATKDQIVTLTAPCPMSLTTEKQSYVAEPNTHVKIPIRVSRGQLIANDVQIDAIIPSHFESVSADTTTIPSDADQGTLSFQFGANPGPFNMPIIIRATMQKENGDDVYAETKFEFASIP